MAEMNDIVKLAVDAHHGRVEKYTVGQSMDVLREALIQANNGSTKVDYRAIRDGKCAGLFTLVEEILSRTVIEDLQDSDFFNSFVEFRDVAEGDRNVFVIEDDDLFTVSEVASGTQGLRRQRIGGRGEVTIRTATRGVRIYEEMNRVLAGRVDFNDMINRVSESFSKQLLDEIFALWSGATAEDMGGEVYFPVAGVYDEDALLDVIAHTEAAASGKTATIIGTKKALRNLAPAIQGIDSKHDLYTMGYYGSFYGTPVMAIPQRHKLNSTEFVMPDNVLTIVAGDDRPIKVVREGDPLVVYGNAIDNADLTQEFLYTESYGMGIVLAGGNAGIGRYEMQ
jgi:hypothetical protein